MAVEQGEVTLEEEEIRGGWVSSHEPLVPSLRPGQTSEQGPRDNGLGRALLEPLP